MAIILDGKKLRDKLLDNYSSNFFVCDFKNQNYFFLKYFCDKKQLELSSFAWYDCV